jgi:hypothetical protein
VEYWSTTVRVHLYYELTRRAPGTSTWRMHTTYSVQWLRVLANGKTVLSTQYSVAIGTVQLYSVQCSYRYQVLVQVSRDFTLLVHNNLCRICYLYMCLHATLIVALQYRAIVLSYWSTITYLRCVCAIVQGLPRESYT